MSNWIPKHLFLFFLLLFSSSCSNSGRIGVNSPNVVEGDKWGIYVIRVKDFLLDSHQMIDIVPLNIQPVAMHASSELRSYDPFLVELPSSNNARETFIFYEPCYFRSDKLNSSGEPNTIAIFNMHESNSLWHLGESNHMFQVFCTTLCLK